MRSVKALLTKSYTAWLVTHAALIGSLCLLVQSSPNYLAAQIALPVSFIKTSDSVWTAELSRLDAGEYYASLGKIKGNCRLYRDGELLDSNQSVVSGIRENLLVGASFSLRDRSQVLRLECEKTKGFRVELAQMPIVSSYRSGVLLQLWRAFTDLILGPLFGLSFLLLSLSQRWTGLTRSQNSTLVGFAGVAVAYSFSLAHYPRLFADELTASYLHVLLRTAFSLSFCLLCGTYYRQRLIVILPHLLFLAVATAIWQLEHSLLDPVYRYFCLVFAASSLVATIDLFRRPRREEFTIILRCVSVAWTVAQILDLKAVFQFLGTFSAPAVLLFITITMSYARLREQRRARRIQQTSNRILAIIESNASIDEILTQLASISSIETHFSRVSAYIDGFCLGMSEHPRQVFVRLMERGYSKETAIDRTIHFLDGRGSYMATATETEEITLRTGTFDKAFFLVVPIGRHACINLSDAVPASSFQAWESEEVIRRLHPALRTLNGRVLAQGFKQGLALEKLRLIRGDGRFDVTLGAVFSDVNNYSVLCEQYGAAFGEFVNAVYFPALTKAVSETAVPEIFRGDEIYLVSLSELRSKKLSNSEAVLKTLLDLHNFMRNEGAELCRSSGYDPITLSTGAAVGNAVVICDPIQVRTAGPTINEAKRLQEAAGAAAALVRTEGLDATSLDYLLGEDEPVLVKKNFIRAKRFSARSQNSVPRKAS
jgi:hypothetical protein